MNSDKLAGNECVEFCFINWLFKFVQMYHRVSLTNTQERLSPRKQVSMVKMRELFTVFMTGGKIFEIPPTNALQ